MLKSISKILLLCVLVSCCAANELDLEELVKSQGPFKPVSPVPLNPQISQIMSALQQQQGKFNPYASSMAMKMMMEQAKDTKPTEMPEISRIMCGCETSLEHEKCVEEPEKKIENIEEIKTIIKKVEKVINKHIFKNTIVKRSIEQMESEGKELIANGKDAKHDIQLMLSIYENIKKMLELNTDKDVETFKSKLMGMPEKEMTLRQLIEELKSTTKSESCDDEMHTIECTPGTQLKIIKAAISNKNKFACPAMIKKMTLKSLSENTESCYEEELTTKLLNATCSGRQECTISVHRDFLNICKCAQQKYLDLTYTCEAAKPEDMQKLSRSKRTIHYRNKPRQEQRDKMMRSGGLFGGFYDYGLYGYGFPFYDYYGGYGYGFPFYDYYGYGYGFPFYDYYGYGYGYGYPFFGAFTYDYDNGYGSGYGNNGGYGANNGGYGGNKGGYGGKGQKGGYGSGNAGGSADDNSQ